MEGDAQDYKDSAKEEDYDSEGPEVSSAFYDTPELAFEELQRTYGFGSGQDYFTCAQAIRMVLMKALWASKLQFQFTSTDKGGYLHVYNKGQKIVTIGDTEDHHRMDVTVHGPHFPTSKSTFYLLDANVLGDIETYINDELVYDAHHLEVIDKLFTNVKVGGKAVGSRRSARLAAIRLNSSQSKKQ